MRVIPIPLGATVGSPCVDHGNEMLCFYFKKGDDIAEIVSVAPPFITCVAKVNANTMFFHSPLMGLVRFMYLDEEPVDPLFKAFTARYRGAMFFGCFFIHNMDQLNFFIEGETMQMRASCHFSITITSANCYQAQDAILLQLVTKC